MPTPTSLPIGSFALIIALVATAEPVSSQTPTPDPCAAPEYRQFDFWVGTWDVTNPQGQRAGENTIRKTMNGCVLHESWRGAGGLVGESFNTWDRTRGVWHQTWVDASGTLLLIEGGLREGAMVLEGQTAGQEGQKAFQRITWSIVDGNPDRVRQLWESSTDDGVTWTVVFDGLYQRRK